MKKFHFYLVDVKPEDIACGHDIGAYIREGYLRWNKNNISKIHVDVVKVTLWLSKNPLKSIFLAKINGSVWLEKYYKGPALRYSHRRVIRAIEARDCDSPIENCPSKEANRWFAYAKVEHVK